MLTTVVNVIWGIVFFLGILTFFTGNGGRASIGSSLPCFLSAIAYYVASHQFAQDLLVSSIAGVLVFIIMSVIVTQYIGRKHNEEHKQ